VIDDIAEKVYGGERIDLGEASRLFAHPNVAELGMLAHWVRMQRHPDPVVTYNVVATSTILTYVGLSATFVPFIASPARMRDTYCQPSRSLPRSTS